MKRMLVLLATLLLTAPQPATASDPPKLEGDWEGTMKVTDAASLRMVFHVKKSDEATYAATFDSPDQGAGGLKVDSATLENDAVTFGLKALSGEFMGKFTDDGAKIEGQWTQLGKSYPLTLARAKPMARPDQIWEGTLAVTGGIELRLVVNLYKAKEDKDKEGAFTATLDSPDQNVKGVKIDRIALDKKRFTFEAKTIRGEFSGDLNDAGTEAKGQWTQGGRSLPLTLKKTDRVTELKRSQTPRAPFPYKEIAVSYPNKGAGISLSGTLTLPEGAGPFPAVVLISGSGPQDRDETLLGHKPFLVLADYLGRRGVGVLRFDDRGVGGSSGNHARATSVDFATDVEAGVAFLKTRPEVNPQKIGLIGHSEGGLIAPMVAAKAPDDIAFVVLLAGPGVPGDAILIAQSELIFKAMGMDEKVLTKQLEMSKKAFEILRTETDEASATKALSALVKSAINELTEEQKKTAGGDLTSAEASIEMIKTPWFRFFLSYDPRPTLAKLTCPVLALNGEKDLQVPPKQNLPEIEKAIRAGGNAKVTVKELPGLNHLFQASKTGAPSEYSRIEETFNPDALKVVGDWILGLE